MMKDYKIIDKAKKISNYSEYYVKIFLKERKDNWKKILTDNKEALFFIFSFSFYRGRRDNLSTKFGKGAKKAINDFFSKNADYLKETKNFLDKKNKNFKDVLKEEYSNILQKLEQESVNNRYDRFMVAHLINFIHSKEEKNIVKYIVSKIRNGKIKEIYNELTSIYEFGPKISSLVLRDTIFLLYFSELGKDYKEKLSKEDFYYLQPIDTWVHQVSKKIGIINEKEEKIYKGEAKDIVDFCWENKIDPIKFNQGVWYIGSNSLDVLLKLLEEGKI